MNKEELAELISRYFDGGLDEGGLTRLESELKESGESRRIYWEIAEIHGLLDEAAGEGQGVEAGKILDGPSGRRYGWGRGIGWAAAAVVALLLVVWWQGRGVGPVQKMVVATMEDGRGTLQFMEAGFFEVGAAKSVELIFRGGARVAIEGAAQLELISDDRMRLIRGKIGVEVPKGSEGFTVDTPDGRVVDFGTRFGLEVGSHGVAKAEVFEGRIDVMLGEETHRMEGRASLWLDDEGRGAVVSGADERAFPMPRSELGWSIAGGFDGGNGLGSGKPKKVNSWSGDHCEIRMDASGIVPKSGAGMLQFVATHSKGDESVSNVAGELWRVIDLEEVTRKMGRRPERVTLSGWFNRVRGGSDTDSRFIMGLGSASLGETRFEWERCESETEVLTDGDIASWERADLEMILQPGFRYLVLMVGAFENVRNEQEIGKAELAGHFVDDVNVKFFSERQSSVKSRFWRGGEGQWSSAGKWSENVLPSGRESAVVQGGGATISKRIVLPESSLIVALDSNQNGDLAVEESGRLELGSGELILGYNPGGEARMTLKGVLVSGGDIFVGRNNQRSTLLIEGGSLTTSRRVTMSQYDSDIDTKSELVIDQGGSLKARALRLINDDATIRLQDGTVEVEVLELGGGSSQVSFEQSGGLVRAAELKADGGTYDLRGGKLELKGKWTKERWNEVFDEPAKGLQFELQASGWTVVTRG